MSTSARSARATPVAGISGRHRSTEASRSIRLGKSPLGSSPTANRSSQCDSISTVSPASRVSKRTEARASISGSAALNAIKSLSNRTYRVPDSSIPGDCCLGAESAVGTATLDSVDAGPASEKSLDSEQLPEQDAILLHMLVGPAEQRLRGGRAASARSSGPSDSSCSPNAAGGASVRASQHGAREHSQQISSSKARAVRRLRGRPSSALDSTGHELYDDDDAFEEGEEEEEDELEAEVQSNRPSANHGPLPYGRPAAMGALSLLALSVPPPPVAGAAAGGEAEEEEEEDGKQEREYSPRSMGLISSPCAPSASQAAGSAIAGAVLPQSRAQRSDVLGLMDAGSPSIRRPMHESSAACQICETGIELGAVDGLHDVGSSSSSSSSCPSDGEEGDQGQEEDKENGGVEAESSGGRVLGMEDPLELDFHSGHAQTSDGQEQRQEPGKSPTPTAASNAPLAGSGPGLALADRHRRRRRRRRRTASKAPTKAVGSAQGKPAAASTPMAMASKVQTAAGNRSWSPSLGSSVPARLQRARWIRERGKQQDLEPMMRQLMRPESGALAGSRAGARGGIIPGVQVRPVHSVQGLAGSAGRALSLLTLPLLVSLGTTLEAADGSRGKRRSRGRFMSWSEPALMHIMGHSQDEDEDEDEALLAFLRVQPRHVVGGPGCGVAAALAGRGPLFEGATEHGGSSPSRSFAIKTQTKTKTKGSGRNRRRKRGAGTRAAEASRSSPLSTSAQVRSSALRQTDGLDLEAGVQWKREIQVTEPGLYLVAWRPSARESPSGVGLLAATSFTESRAMQRRRPASNAAFGGSARLRGATTSDVVEAVTDCLGVLPRHLRGGEGQALLEHLEALVMGLDQAEAAAAAGTAAREEGEEEEEKGIFAVQVDQPETQAPFDVQAALEAPEAVTSAMQRDLQSAARGIGTAGAASPPPPSPPPSTKRRAQAVLSLLEQVRGMMPARSIGGSGSGSGSASSSGLSSPERGPSSRGGARAVGLGVNATARSGSWTETVKPGTLRLQDQVEAVLLLRCLAQARGLLIRASSAVSFLARLGMAGSAAIATEALVRHGGRGARNRRRTTGEEQARSVASPSVQMELDHCCKCLETALRSMAGAQIDVSTATMALFGLGARRGAWGAGVDGFASAAEQVHRLRSVLEMGRRMLVQVRRALGLVGSGTMVTTGGEGTGAHEESRWRAGPASGTAVHDDGDDDYDMLTPLQSLAARAGGSPHSSRVLRHPQGPDEPAVEESSEAASPVLPRAAGAVAREQPRDGSVGTQDDPRSDEGRTGGGLVGGQGTKEDDEEDLVDLALVEAGARVAVLQAVDQMQDIDGAAGDGEEAVAPDGQEATAPAPSSSYSTRREGQPLPVTAPSSAPAPVPAPADSSSSGGMPKPLMEDEPRSQSKRGRRAGRRHRNRNRKRGGKKQASGGAGNEGGQEDHGGGAALHAEQVSLGEKDASAPHQDALEGMDATQGTVGADQAVARQSIELEVGIGSSDPGNGRVRTSDRHQHDGIETHLGKGEDQDEEQKEGENEDGSPTELEGWVQVVPWRHTLRRTSSMDCVLAREQLLRGSHRLQEAVRENLAKAAARRNGAGDGAVNHAGGGEDEDKDEDLSDAESVGALSIRSTPGPGGCSTLDLCTTAAVDLYAQLARSEHRQVGLVRPAAGSVPSHAHGAHCGGIPVCRPSPNPQDLPAPRWHQGQPGNCGQHMQWSASGGVQHAPMHHHAVHQMQPPRWARPPPPVQFGYQVHSHGMCPAPFAGPGIAPSIGMHQARPIQHAQRDAAVMGPCKLPHTRWLPPPAWAAGAAAARGAVPWAGGREPARVHARVPVVPAEAPGTHGSGAATPSPQPQPAAVSREGHCG